MERCEIAFADELDACTVKARALEGILLAISEADSEIGGEALALLHWTARDVVEGLDRARALGLTCAREARTGGCVPGDGGRHA